MRLTTIRGDDGPTLALAFGALHVPAAAARAHLGTPAGPTDTLELIEAGPAAWSDLRAVHGALDATTIAHLAVRDAIVLAPIPRPRRNVLCIGRNYADHAAEQGAAAPDAPVFFTKATGTVTGPDTVVPVPPGVAEFDYEGELAVIVGRRARDVPRAAALDLVFGYTVLNDLTARDAQRRHLQWFKGKSFDLTCPMGPAIVTPDEVGDLADVRVRTFVNGELRQDQGVSDMLFDIATVLAELSVGMTLEPGDVIATGTPSGVGAPTRRFLKAGDEVIVDVTHVGTLRTTIGPSA